MTEQPQPIDRLLDAIRQGQAHMRPKWRYVLNASLIVASAVLLSLLVVYLVSLVVFAWHAGGTGILPHFGLTGWQLALRAVPWWLVLIALAGIVILFMVIERTTKSYRRPAILVFAGLLGLAILSGFGVAEAGFHERFSQFSEQHRIPLFGSGYRHLREREGGLVTIGTIQSTATQSFVLTTKDGESVTVNITDDAAPGNWQPKVGEMVAVIGKRVGQTIAANGIRPLNGFQPQPWWPGGQPPPMMEPDQGQ